MDTSTAQRLFCSRWLTPQAGHHRNFFKQDGIVPVAIPYTVVQAMDPHLVTETIFTLPAMPHRTQNLTRTSDTPTVHHPATVIAAPSIHSWQEVAVLNPMKSKCFMKLLETNELK